jgi:menaquinone-dependent protoporphyrinogen oxidase
MRLPVFAGKLMKKQLSFGERAIVMAFRAPEGDFRDWQDVGTWALGIANALASEPRAG